MDHCEKVQVVTGLAVPVDDRLLPVHSPPVGVANPLQPDQDVVSFGMKAQPVPNTAAIGAVGQVVEGTFFVTLRPSAEGCQPVDPSLTKAVLERNSRNSPAISLESFNCFPVGRSRTRIGFKQCFADGTGNSSIHFQQQECVLQGVGTLLQSPRREQRGPPEAVVFPEAV